MEKLDRCLKKIGDLPNESPHKVNIKGKWYTTVATRLEVFREVFGTEGKITQKIISADLDRVVMKANIHVFQNDRWEKIGDGYAEEFRESSNVNRNSALENCSTSCIGRALANLGLHGSEFASAFEVQNAIERKPAAPKSSQFMNESISKISKDFLS